MNGRNLRRNDYVEYKSVYEGAKSVVIKAKFKKYDKAYERLETKEEEREKNPGILVMHEE